MLPGRRFQNQQAIFGVNVMSFEWLNRFQQATGKEPGYSEKTLAAYRLGMRARGSIRGVVIVPATDCCEAAHNLPRHVYDPDSAPQLPLTGCPRGSDCGCVYRPFMSYQSGEEEL